MPSTVIRRFAYDPALEALDVEFVTGRVYRYRGVPEAVARGLAGARSKGGWFNRAIRDRFGYVRLRCWPSDDAA
ncbi:MAG: KTSC domain-containing protein [Tsuneonella sp.]